jgi:arylsulfatase A-like enzyme
VDHHFGRILQALEETGQAEDTLVIFTTDHGAGSARGKRYVYEPGVEIALLMRPPRGAGFRAGYRVPHLIQNIDFFPTLLEAAGAPVPGGIDGRSFWPVLTGNGDYTPHEHLFIERNFHGERDPTSGVTGYVDKWDPQRLVRTQNFAYVRNCKPEARKRPHYAAEMTGLLNVPGFEGAEFAPVIDEERPAEELYDLRHDPWEQTNVAGRSEYADAQRDLAAKLDHWMRETNDPGLRPEVIPPPLTDPVEWPVHGKVVEVAQR